MTKFMRHNIIPLLCKEGIGEVDPGSTPPHPSPYKGEGGCFIISVSVRRMLALLTALCLITIPASSDAGLIDLAKRVKVWWSSRSIGVISLAEDGGAPTDDGGDGEQPADTDGEGGAKPGTGTQAIPGMCQAPQEPAEVHCELGSEFLCVETPPGGVAGDHVVIRGTIDRQGSVLASMRIAAQNEYTKTTSSIDTSAPAESGCLDDNSSDRPFCLDKDGRFSAEIKLPENGPYTISVSASRLSGESLERKVRVSRVIAPLFDEKALTLEPDVRKDSTVDAPQVMVSVSLLGDCQFCDFIGAATHGVAVSVENVIKDNSGKERRISCSTTVEQGGQGKFMVGVPVGAGTNTLTVSACNAAVESNCPKVSGITFTGAGGAVPDEGITFVSPPPQPSYDSAEYPTIPWKFSLATGGECVDVRVNREAPQELCPDGGGGFSTTISPKYGINVASISRKGGAEEFAWTFGWGSIKSPYAGEGGTVAVPSAAELGLPASTAKEMLLPLINNYLASDEFRAMLNSAFEGDQDSSDKPADEPVREAIPGCETYGGGDFTVKVRGKPQIGDAAITNFAMSKDKVDLSLVMDNVSAGVNLIPNNGLPPLPLIVSFLRMGIDLSLVIGKSADGRMTVLMSSPHDDCSFKAGSYCTHKPAALIPANFMGGADATGGFIKCDVSLAEGKAREACAAINNLNAQTGIVSEKVLDAVNDALYCGGSEFLTRMAHRGINLDPICIGGCSSGTEGASALSALPAVSVPVGVSIGGGSGISQQGLLLEAGVSFGNAETYAKTPASVRIPSAGIIASRGFGEKVFNSATDGAGDLNLALSLDAVNSLLFTATVQGDGRDVRGLLDIDVTEKYFSDLEFDFVKECDEFTPPKEGEEKSDAPKAGQCGEPEGKAKEKSTLCALRPRVSELLGSALTSYGYFPGNYPLLVAVRGNRALPPRVEAVSLAELPVVKNADAGGVTTKAADSTYTPSGSLMAVELGGLTISFYALQIDEKQQPDKYGNLPIKLDAQGHPVIKSMLPEDSDPWKGQIISFDLSALIGIEVGDVAADPCDAAQFSLPIRILSDRSRLVLTPINGSNSTTVPSAGLVSLLAEELKYALSSLSNADKPFSIPLPRSVPFKADDEGMFGALGLAKIDLGNDGLALRVESDANKLVAAITASITQILHKGGKEEQYKLP